jgi:hypothetical protein
MLYFTQGEVIVRGGKCRDLKTIKKEDEVLLSTRATLLNGEKQSLLFLNY